jgi:hypothetical protein
MKTCPVCQRPYADETMVFCLADGAELVNVSRRLDLDATWRLTPASAEPPPTRIAPTVPASQTAETKPQSTIEYRPELHVAQPQTVTTVPNQTRSVLPWIFGMVVILAGSAILIAVILTRSKNSESAQLPSATQQTTASPTPETKTPDKPVATSTTSANKPKSAAVQPTVPATKSLIRSQPRRRETSKVVTEKKKVEQPKPTGESFIPVKP